MKKMLFLVILAVFVLSFSAPAETGSPNEALARKNLDVLKIGTFVTAQTVAGEFKSEDGLARAAAILKPLGVTKIILDTYRDGLIPDRKILTRARDYFMEQGFEVAGGITTTSGKDFAVPSPTHRYWICYDNDISREAIRKIAEYAASIFDEVIVDDFLATDCECEDCAARKGDRGAYFRDVMVGISRDQIVGAAKAANPKVKVIIKYPQWYDRLHTFGYDVSRQPEIFDNVWVGTETRDPAVENVQQYEAFVNYSWHKSISTGRLTGAWFDQINTYPEVYMEQAYQSVLAGAPEITLFGYSAESFSSPNIKFFGENLAYLFTIADALKGTQSAGVYAYKPMNSDGGSENYIFDYLGMFGIPVVPVAAYPEKAKSVILSQHAAADPAIAEKIKATVSAGGTVLMTAGLLELLKNDATILKLAGMEAPGAKKLKSKYADVFIINGRMAPVAGYVEIGERLRAGDAKVLVEAQVEDEKFPAVTVKQHESGGRVVVFNGRTFSYMPGSRDLIVPYKVSYIKTPGEVMSLLRDIATEPLGFNIKMPSLIGAYLFGDELIAFDNFNDHPADIGITFAAEKIGRKVKRLAAYDGGRERPDEYGVISFTMPKRSMRLFRIEYEE